MRPSLVFTSGLTSTRSASSATKVSHRVAMASATPSATSAGNFAWATISRAFSMVTPALVIVDRDLREGLGVFSATSSMSMPPCTEAMARKVRLVRSRRYGT
ncbi:hypothetical protein SALBM135S_10146 [Streptomyces alboniger]